MCVELLLGRGCSPPDRGPLSKIKKIYYLYYKYVYVATTSERVYEGFYLENKKRTREIIRHCIGRLRRYSERA